MRDNGPVNDREYVVPDDEVIITHTDPSSRITYANPAFLESSQFSLEECLGQTHNIVRHPDMPELVFADLWATIRAGRSWTGIVKNRRKEGGFYWVRSNITPIVEDGRTVGYMSVRVKPTREEVATAQRAYRDLRAGRATNFRIQAGRIVDTSLGGVLSRLSRPSLRAGTWVFLGMLSILLVGLTVHSFFTQGSSLITVLHALGASIAISNMLYVQGNVVQPLLSLQKAALQLLVGDTRTRLPQQGVLCVAAVAGSLEQLRVKLDGILKDNRRAAERAGRSVTEVVRANSELSARTSSHASGFEQTAASLEELTVTVQRNTESARQALELAGDSSQATARGREVVKEVHEAMLSIAESSKKIGEIVGIIDGIAFQTNLLALNAAVEAARAGEQGRGFAVVAQEVRNLAQRSAQAAKQIRVLIDESQSTVAHGSDLARGADEAMTLVVEFAKRVTDVIAKIEVANGEQAVGIGQINAAVTQMESMTQADAELAQQLMQTAATLESQSAMMLAAMSAFSVKADERGFTSASIEDPSPRADARRAA